MELRHLRYFRAVVEELSFTRASAALRVAQSAISSQVQDLENELGVALLNRNSRTMQLTAAGTIFFEVIQRVFETLDSGIRQSRRAGKEGAGTLAIGFIGSQSHEWMPRVLKRLRTLYPELEISLTELVPSQQLEALLAGTLDVGLIGPIEGKAQPGLRVECISEERPMIGLPVDHPLADQSSLSLTQLRDEPFIFTSRANSPSYRAYLRRLCAQAEFTPRVVQEVDRARTGVQYVAAGFGISIFAEHISRFPAPGVRFIPLRPAGPKIRYGLVWRRGNINEMVQRFIQFTIEQVPMSAKLPEV
jgi:DNA-binding transcriptional LysR family regulator